MSRSLSSICCFSSSARSAACCFSAALSISCCSCRQSSSLWTFSCCSWASMSSFSVVSLAMTSTLDCSFFLALVFTSLQREANSSVLTVSSRLNLEGLMQARSSVRLLPMRASFSNSVSLESRNGGTALPPGFVRSEITRPSVVRDWLMPMPSLRRAPVAPLFFCFSLPARSTKWILAWLSTEPPARLSNVRIWTVKTAWERDEAAFICVAPTARRLAPKSKSSRASSKLPMGHSVRPTTMAPRFGCSRTCSSPPASRPLLLRRSKSFSLYISR
mmetsp:Transcript_62567/g.201767  ORF Transcript_62567/g.201767 Transcript_62567/m.201767 type:complete len:274 (+) Transcript_62567:1918-2739(+)